MPIIMKMMMMIICNSVKMRLDAFRQRNGAKEVGNDCGDDDDDDNDDDDNDDDDDHDYDDDADVDEDSDDADDADDLNGVGEKKIDTILFANGR